MKWAIHLPDIPLGWLYTRRHLCYAGLGITLFDLWKLNCAKNRFAFDEEKTPLLGQ